ncbi:hypothetical protein BDV37DRAFT_235500 [Aspergillus pseudonomiae]|uniref:Uncharacterized protein n=1 Tax=Aspergillus pseudonomiae TaxID=1506151 RepID=A0A5N7DU40_9EURO|nr:uncharacterized protein BDV37DRAFT_235500 [Aspergillus pseudonomiae]KAE8409990.1 hypothetical protein BDV37DRAFT_235500 [Aspergillus pseudonomiae]
MPVDTLISLRVLRHSELILFVASILCFPLSPFGGMNSGDSSYASSPADNSLHSYTLVCGTKYQLGSVEYLLLMITRYTE